VTSTLTPAAGPIETLADLLDRLGGIPPRRVRFHPAPGTATESDLVASMSAPSQATCELVDGVLVEKAMGFPESVLAGAILARLRAVVLPANLGLVSGADGTMRLFPGLVRAPDVAYTSWDRVPGRRLPADPVAGFAPDQAVEVLSRGNTAAEMVRKRREYFQAGVRLVWLVDPASRTVTVFDGAELGRVFDAAGVLDGGDLLPGFQLPLAELFDELDRQG